jgi:hypothetical protein
MCNCNIKEIYFYKIRYIITNSWVLFWSPKHLYNFQGITYKFRVIFINYDILLQIPEYYYTFLRIISKSKTLLQNPVVLRILGYCYKISYIIKNPQMLFKTFCYYYKSRYIITNSETLLQIPGYNFKFPDITTKGQTFSFYTLLYVSRIIPNSQPENNPTSPRGVVK